MRTQNWLVDFDSTTNNMDLAQVRSCNAKFGTSYKPSDITSWDWWKTDVPSEVGRFVWGSEVFHNREWTLAIPEMPRAIHAINAIRARGDGVVIVSDRPQNMHEWIVRWFELRGVFVPVIVTSRAGYTKLQAAQDHNLTVACDDAPHNVEMFAASAQFDRIYMMSRACNTHISLRPVSRVFSWFDLLDMEGIQ